VDDFDLPNISTATAYAKPFLSGYRVARSRSNDRQAGSDCAVTAVQEIQQNPSLAVLARHAFIEKNEGKWNDAEIPGP
jgi:hypothetical protein